MDNFLFKLFLLIFGILVIRFAVVQFKKYRDSKKNQQNNFFDKILFILFFALIIGLIFYSIQSLFTKANADSVLVIDGDTIKINGKNLRFSGIDAPETNYRGKPQMCIKEVQKVNCGILSKKYLIKLIGNNKVVCDVEPKPDQYNRLLGECFINNESLSSALVRNGYAFDYPRYSKKKFASDQEYAKSNKLGLWSMKFDFPWEFRKKNN
tara:strand:+ start:94 stop:720 length:627 start_codon:yes stop_codon:yes gene_type:complete